jgi:hypothetical protein
MINKSFQSLPNELLITIFDELDIEDQLAISKVNKHFMSICKSMFDIGQTPPSEINIDNRLRFRNPISHIRLFELLI